MAHLIFKCPYLKPGTNARRGNYVRYIATRDGVELVAKRGNYVDYIANRPKVEKLGSHGLFTAGDESVVLSRIADEAANHSGNLWLPIISLKREDAERLGYDNVEAWLGLLPAYANDLAAAMKISPERFRWYAAFHDEGDHPHVHMVVWSSDPSEGYLSKEGIRQIKSGLAARLFRDDLLHIYERQTRYRSELGARSRERMAELIAVMQSGELHNERIELLVIQLSERLKKHKGKKQYGYLQASDKLIVDAIVDELCADPRVAECYELWCEVRLDVLRTYVKNPPHPGPLSKQPELKRIRNIVIEEALGLRELKTASKELPEPEREAVQDTPQPVHVAERKVCVPLGGVATRLLRNLGNIFQENPPIPERGSITDRKVLRRMRQMKTAQGHAEDEQQQTY